MPCRGERKVCHRGQGEDRCLQGEDRCLQVEVEEDHHQDKEDDQDQEGQVDHHQAQEDHHQVKDKVHLQVIHLTEAHHQAKVVLQVADHKAHQWEVLHNKALETYLEMHQIL